MKVFFNDVQLETVKTMTYPAPYIKRSTAQFVNFKLGKAGVLKIECDSIPQKVDIRPKRFDIKYIINKNVVEIKIEKPCNFSVEFSADCNDGLMVFAGKERVVKKRKFENVIVFKKGRHFADVVNIKQDNTLVYLEEGAYIDGKIRAENCSNITIAGNGIISMEKYSRSCGRTTVIQLGNCRNVCVKDITILDSCNWSMCISGCDNVSVDNCKIIGQRGNSDGIDVCGSKNVYVKNCFTRVWDDSLVVKAFNTGDVYNVVFENCVLWNDFARPIEVGVELRAEKVHNVHFRNIDIIHSPTGYPVMGIHHGDRADVFDISFENINIEDAPAAQIFDIHIRDSIWNKDAKKGKIHDVLFKNIRVVENCNKALSPPRIFGFNPDITVDNIIFDNVSICGMAARNAEELNLITNDYVKNIKFKTYKMPYINLVKTNIEIKKDFEYINGYYEGIVTVAAENVSDKDVSGSCNFEIKPSFRAKILGSELSFELKPQQSASKDYKVVIPPGKFVFEVQSADAFVKCDWKFMNFNMRISNTFLSAHEYEFTNCFGKKFGSVKFALKDGLLMLKSELLKKNEFVVYLAKPVPMQKGEVMFSVEETDWANAPAVINGENGAELAPQLRCPAEITYVFKNEPKVEKIIKINISQTLTGECYIDISNAVNDGKFWFEVEVDNKEEKRYPLCLFGSQEPDKICHMFVSAVKKITSK